MEKQRSKKEYLGFIEPIITPEHYVLGGGFTPQVILQENGNWDNFLPTEELQSKNDLETYNCTSFNTINAIEILLLRLFGERTNYSDRWLGIIAGTKPPGNDPHTVCEAIRKYGLIPEAMLPFSEDIQTVEEYYSFKDADEVACYKAGREWLQKYDFKHEWVFDKSQPLDEKINNMRVALQYSPLAGAVYAWTKDVDGKYFRAGTDNHWTDFYKLHNVFDTYDPVRKELESDFGYNYVKRFHIEKRKQPLKRGWWFVDIFKRLFRK